MSDKKNNKILYIIIVISVVLLIVASISTFFLFKKNIEIEEMQEQFAIDKSELEDEYESISLQYEGFKFSVQNDSLQYKLENEQAKVQRLLEELKTVKSTNHQEVRRLKAELSSLRKILKSYVEQIDSLNRVNAELKEENSKISSRYKATTQSLTKITKEKEALTEKVVLASKLDAINVQFRAINGKGKVQKRLKRSEKFEVKFSISKNITAKPGERTIYARILKPDGDVFVNSSGESFAFESGNIPYSMKRVVEYGGEEMPVVLYWDIDEFLVPGTYKVDIFADGRHIGSSSIVMEQ